MAIGTDFQFQQVEIDLSYLISLLLLISDFNITKVVFLDSYCKNQGSQPTNKRRNTTLTKFKEII